MALELLRCSRVKQTNKQKEQKRKRRRGRKEEGTFKLFLIVFIYVMQ